MNRFLRDILFLAVAALTAAPLSAALTDRYWNNAGLLGDFNDGANWDIDSPSTGTGPLNSYDTAYINDGGTANISSDVIPVLQWLYVGNGAGNSGTVHQTAGTITVNGCVRSIGANGGTGAYTMDGGTLTMSGFQDNTMPFTPTSPRFGASAAARAAPAR